MRRVQGGFRGVCCRRPGGWQCDEITERDGRNFLTPPPLLFSTLRIQPNPLAVCCLCFCMFGPSSWPDGRGMVGGASGEDKRTRLVLNITHVGQPKPYNNLHCWIAPPQLTRLMPLVASHYVQGGGRGKCESTCRCTLLDGRMMGVIQFLSVLSISRSYQSSCAYRHVPRSIPPILVSPTSLHDGFISSLT